MAQMVWERFELSRIIFLPCAIQPHKDAASLATPEHRLAMVDMAICGNPFFELSDIECRRGGLSYTVDTLRIMKQQHPGAELYFIIGADTVFELHAWKAIDVVLELCQFIVVGRPGYRLDRWDEATLRLPAPWPHRLREYVCQGRQIDISSTDIRHRVAEGLSIRYLVPEPVEMMITEHQLYR